jgi:uncharacterized membrane protein HdeD (DUF308 family)
MPSFCVIYTPGRWKVLLAPGSIALILGLLILLFPSESLRVVVYILGAIALLAGIGLIAGAWALSRAGARTFAVSLVMGFAALLIGIITILEPDLVESSLAVVFGALLLLAGLGAAINGWSGAASGWQGLLAAIGGCAVAVIGVIIIFTPDLSARVVVQVLGGLLFAIGVVVCLAALAMRWREGRQVQDGFRRIERS